MIRSLALFFALLAQMAARVDAQQLTPSQSASVDSLARAAIHAGPLAGMTVAILHASAAPWIKAYGLSDRERAVPASATTVYRIRSISKTFTAAAILQLAARGRIALDSDVTRYLPDAPTRGVRITVRELIGHTSGLPNYHGAVWRAHYRERLPAAEWVHLFDAEPLAFAPGADYAYSNLAFDLLALIVERASGEAFPEYLRRHVTGPLRLRDITHCTEEAPPAKRAAPYEVRQCQLMPADAWADVEYGAAMLCATAGDLVAWARALDGGRVLDARWLAEMRSPTRLADGTAIGYGLGTRLGSVDDHSAVGHTGSGGGWSSALVDFPADRLTIAVLTNTESESTPERVAAAIARVVLGAPLRAMTPTPAAVVAADTGRWVSGTDTATIVEVAGGLAFRPPHTPASVPGVPLEYVGGNRFRFAPSPDNQIQFLPADAADHVGSRSSHALTYAGVFYQAVVRRAP